MGRTSILFTTNKKLIQAIYIPIAYLQNMNYTYSLVYLLHANHSLVNYILETQFWVDFTVCYKGEFSLFPRLERRYLFIAKPFPSTKFVLFW